jgi:hypothetical protein
MTNIPQSGPAADTLLVLTSRNARQIIESGGSGRWALDPNRARRMEYLVCVQFDRDDLDDFDPVAPYKSAFLVGKISGVQNVTEPSDKSQRWLVKLDEVAHIDMPDMWDGKRASIRYTTLVGLGIDADALHFEKIEHAAAPPTARNGKPSSADVAQTIANAKASLASELGVDPTAIEIVIRW